MSRTLISTIPYNFLEHSVEWSFYVRYVITVPLKNFYRHSQYLECWIFTSKVRTAHVNRCVHDEITL